MIGVVVPAHDEQLLLPACLQALAAAARRPGLAGERVVVVVAADACTDATAAVAAAAGVEVVELAARSVGAARRAAADRLLALGARWLASTDADTLVHPDWLERQLAEAEASGADAVFGVVDVLDWSGVSPSARARHLAAYSPREGHRHVHGANCGVSRQAYLLAGGWPAVTCHEDVLLVERLLASGACISWSARARVTTSARRDARARGGFGDYLLGLETA